MRLETGKRWGILPRINVSKRRRQANQIGLKFCPKTRQNLQKVSALYRIFSSTLRCSANRKDFWICDCVASNLIWSAWASGGLKVASCLQIPDPSSGCVCKMGVIKTESCISHAKMANIIEAFWKVKRTIHPTYIKGV